MNKLEKWLWVNCTLKDNGQTSNSLYFYYRNLEIRYSDHMAKQSTGDLQIIKSSVFDSINYAVFIRGSAKIMIINASNTIDFIIHYAQVNECLKQAIMQYFKQSCGFNTVFTKYLKENKVSFIQAINLYKILIFSNKTPFSGGNLSKVYNYIKSLESNKVQKIQLE